MLSASGVHLRCLLTDPRLGGSARTALGPAYVWSSQHGFRPIGPAARALIFQKIAHDGATEMDGIVAWKREKEKETLAHRELSKLQTMDRRHQLKQAELAAFDDNESLMKEAKAQADEMFESMTGRQPQGQPLAVTLQGLRPVDFGLQVWRFSAL